MNEMLTFPVLVLTTSALGLMVFSVYLLHLAQLASDKVDGIVHTTSSARVLLLQKSRAERTAAICFAAGFLLAMLAVGTMEFPG